MQPLLYIFFAYTLMGSVADCPSVFAQSADLQAKLERLLRKGVDSLQTQQELQQAVQLCQDFINEHDKNPGDSDSLLVTSAYLLKGKILKRQRRGSGDMVIGELKRGLRRQPNNPDLNREIGLELLELEKFGEARPYLEKAVQFKRDDNEAWRALIDLYEKRGKPEERVSIYQRFLAVDSTDAEVWMKLGETHLKLDKKTEAEQAFVQAVRYNPRESLPHLQLALLREERRDWIGAEKEFKAALEHDPANAIAKEHLPTVQSYAQEDKAIKQSLQKANQALQSYDPREWEAARTDLLGVLEKKPEIQEAKEQLKEARRKLYNYWYSEGRKADSLGQKSDSLLARAADCFTVSVVYADSKQERDRAFDRYRQSAIKLNRKIDARNAQEAAQRALATKEFDTALRKLTEALALDTSLSEEIQPKISETERQITIKSLESRYQAAINKHDWHAARVFLLELIELEPNNAEFGTALKNVESKIAWEKTKLALSLALWGLGLAAIISLFLRFRKKLTHFLKWLFERKVIASMTLLLLSSLVFIIIFWTTLWNNIPVIIEWANRNEGAVGLVGFLFSVSTVGINALWGIFVYKRYQSTKEPFVLEHGDDDSKGREKKVNGKLRYRPKVTGTRGRA